MNFKFTLVSFEVGPRDTGHEAAKVAPPKAETPPAGKVVMTDFAKHTPGFILKLAKWLMP